MSCCATALHRPSLIWNSRWSWLENCKHGRCATINVQLLLLNWGHVCFVWATAVKKETPAWDVWIWPWAEEVRRRIVIWCLCPDLGMSQPRSRILRIVSGSVLGKAGQVPIYYDVTGIRPLLSCLRTRDIFAYVLKRPTAVFWAVEERRPAYIVLWLGVPGCRAMRNPSCLPWEGLIIDDNADDNNGGGGLIVVEPLLRVWESGIGYTLPSNTHMGGSFLYLNGSGLPDLGCQCCHYWNKC